MSVSGSGIILTQDGLIATNAHVISGGDSFSVRLYGDGQQRYTGTVIGHDTKTDLAVLKIPASGLTPAVLGKSDEVKLGEAVCALGNPAGLNSSITTGIISGIKRKVRADSTNFEMECFQTDAAISPGNSGGALVNMFGQVIGITSSKYSSRSVFDSGAYEGLGFAITINEALPILKELMEQGYVSGRVRIGIRFLENTVAWQQTETALPQELNGTGILIAAIDEDSDLMNTELKVDDWILTMNGKAVSDYDSINAAIEGAKAGDTVHCRCGRVREDGTLQTFEIDFRLLEDHSGDY
jgi:serine protease Do